MTRDPSGRRPRVPVTDFAAMAIVGSIGALLVAGARTLPAPVFEPVGPAAFPLWAGIALMVLAVGMIVEASIVARKAGPAVRGTGVPAPERKDLALGTIVLTGLYGLAMDVGGIGFSVATGLFVFSLIVLLAGRQPKTMLFAIIVALILSFGLNAVFTKIFYIDLPS